MNKFSAIEKTNFINDEFKRYIKSTFQIGNATLENQFDSQLKEVVLTKGPYISLLHPFATGKTIRELVHEEILVREFLHMEELKLDRPLYKHQEKAIRKSCAGKNLIVSTGTGSGKTESFLIPILNKILSDREKGIHNRGVQALLLYPMNALANDQRERVRGILKGFSDITFGFYTGETEEFENKAQEYYISENKRKPLVNEIISREEVRKAPPNILFTNYSMLEYLLLRPTDGNIFESKNTSYWHYIVLDEAHVYRGAKGIEISMLMRRLLGKINSEPKFILTSATLVEDESTYEEVIQFAERLTSRNYDNESIIIGEREELSKPDNAFTLDKDKYKEYLINDGLIEKDFCSYFDEKNKSKSYMLYKLILHDSNFYEFKSALSRPRKVDELRKYLFTDWTEEHVASLIDCVAKVNSSKDLFLVDIRYHTFIKSLDGAHISLKPNINVSLKKTERFFAKDDCEDQVMAFKLGLCKYCKASYLIGRILEQKDREYFCQLDAEEIYEQFGEGYSKEANMLLIKEFIDAREISNIEDYLEMFLCNKCGCIYEKNNIAANKCNCGESYIIETLMIERDKTKNKTNISKCINCGSSSSSGVVEDFSIGREAASALVAQLLYKTLGGNKTKAENIDKKTNNPFMLNTKKENKKEEKVIAKQILAFSDSRQEASFFATFFEEKHESFLRKRLLIEALKNEKSINILDLISNISSMLEKENLFSNNLTARQQAAIAVLIELLNIERNFSLSGLGLLSFLPRITIEEGIKDKISEEFDGMTEDVFISILYFILNNIRAIPAIDYFDKIKLEYDVKQKYLQYRFSDNCGLVLKPEDKGTQKNSYSLIPARKLGNRYTSYLTRALDINYEKAKEYLEKIFLYLCHYNILTPNPNLKSVYTVKIGMFDVYNREHVNWYQCNKCHTLCWININNTCTDPYCDGKLESCSPDDIYKHNFYYQEYLSKEIEKIRIEEHTAQIERKTAREYQRDFEKGDINILSSSTTFEMGVDLGDLDTVYLRNVPPTAANYVQRAGRAGRRDDTAAYILTFVVNRSHDYTFFENPLKMIEGRVIPPYFEIKNYKIINRHIVSEALSRFFRDNPEYSKNTDSLILNNGNSGSNKMNGIEEFMQYINENKNDFVEHIDKYIKNGFKKDCDKWYEEVLNVEFSGLKIMEEDIVKKLQQLEVAFNSEKIDSKERTRIKQMIENIKEDSIVNVLSRYNVIPRYGFPVDTVRLEIPSDIKKDLNRDLTLAISEYAPDSEIVADKRKYRSRYIAMHKGKMPIQYYYEKCTNCSSLSISLNREDENLKICHNCQCGLGNFPKKFVKPIYGFISEFEELKDRELKPKRTYSSDYYYIGEISDEDEKMSIKNVMTIKTVKDNHLAIINENPFFMCPVCGYTEINRKNSSFEYIKKEHKSPRVSTMCENQKLEKISLGHEFRTDIIVVDFISANFETQEMQSLLYALLEGISLTFEIERNDISGIVQSLKGRKQMVIFDSVPGGAGHVKRLLNEKNFLKALDASLEKVSQDCCDETTSCYQCIRSYTNQSVHRFLKRGLAKQAIEKLKNDIQNSKQKLL